MAQHVLLITGASSGNGAAVARRLARPGMALLLHARGGVDGAKRPALRALADEVAAAGATAEIVFSDLSGAGANTLVATAIDRFGRLDQIVSNAGFALPDAIGQP